jgi:hypothetical protein
MGGVVSRKRAGYWPREAACWGSEVFVEGYDLAISDREGVDEAVSRRCAVELSGRAAPGQHGALAFGEVVDLEAEIRPVIAKAGEERADALMASDVHVMWQHLGCMPLDVCCEVRHYAGMSPRPNDS